MSASHHRKKRGVLSLTLGMSLAAGLGVAGIVATNQSASAAPRTVEDPKEAAQMVTICNNVMAARAAGEDEGLVSTCVWTNTKVSNPADAKSTVVGDDNNAQKFVNCGDGTLKETVSWSRSSDTTTSLSGSVMGATDVSALFVSFEATVTYSVGGEWTSGRNYTASTLLEVPPGETGWITHTEKRVKGTGDLLLNLKDTGELLIKDVEFDAPAKESTGTIGTHTRKHTASDTEICKNAPAPIIVEGSEAGGLKVADGSDLPDLG